MSQRSLLAATGCALLVVAALQVVRSQGLLAVSDDDYARVVIAQEFAQNPRFDPSGTSWLPFPFWITGAGLKAWGATLSHARWISVVLNGACCALLCALGRGLGLRRGQAVCLTLGSALLPSALWLGAAPIPEFSSAMLLTVSCVSLLTQSTSWWRALGGAAAFLACASRYETWPVALGVVTYNAWDLVRGASVRNAGPLGTACATGLAFPLAWMLHGTLQHHDALFFMERVSKYRSALGLGAPTLGELIAGYPRALVLVEPLPWLLGLSGLGLVFAQRLGQAPRQTGVDRVPAARVVTLLALQVVVLVLGEARGGAPTHHPERALLAVWTSLSFLAGYVWCSCVPRARHLAVGCAVYLLAAHLVAPWSERLAASRLRASEEDVGQRLAARSSREIVGLATNDYGYFAIMAAAGSPARFKIWSRHDPRERGASVALPTWIEEQPLTLLVAPRGTAVKRAQADLSPARDANAKGRSLSPLYQSQRFVIYTVQH